ncbi:MAG TPA: mannose-6-phosphate isomerase, class I [Myxococcota bacterium]|nr:mannose-6-phosphate isomerase, class I [Myxococcota bacterium]
MQPISPLRGVVRYNAWGSRTFIPELLGLVAPAREPHAELWLGAHPTGPSRVATEAGEVFLDAFIARDPIGVLGADVARRFEGALPFLLKVLAAEQPLALQAHPSAAQARAGFERENAAGLALDAPRRSYRDPNPKPEMICALTPFSALCGFRPLPELLLHLTELGAPEPLECAARLRARGEAALEDCIRTLWTLSPSARARVLARALACAQEREGAHWDWVRRLADAHPGDIGLLAPLLLNLVELAPGEALFLDAGCPHSYLQGVGVEVMANSDNVLRGGLTRKHVDVPGLLDTLVFSAGPIAPLQPLRVSGSELRYAAPAPEFALSMLQIASGAPYLAPSRHGVEILLCTEGEGRIAPEGAEPGLAVRRGGAWLAPASAGAYRIEGACSVWKAGVPA